MTILIISLLCSPFSLLIAKATDGYYNNTASYNCYAYAINRIVINGAFYRPNSDKPTYQPGDISEDIYNNFDVDFYGYDLNRVKCNVINDLYAMGYTDVLIYSNIEDYNAYNSMLSDIDFSTQELICLRVGTTDYHFMRYDSATSAWYNKIGDGLIFEYTDNNGIPSNDVAWTGSGNIYDSDIMYIIYDKLQVIIPESCEREGSITVKGGITDISADNCAFCCENEACCNPNGICECENEVINGGKDALYEIVVPNSCEYTIQLSTDYSEHDFNCEIYSYNMYNGNYVMLGQGSGNSTTGATKTVNFTTYDDYNDGSENWQYQVYKHYIRLDFGKLNTSDVTVNVNITHTHDYTHNYEQSSTAQHKAYCWCGEYEIQSHSFNHSFEQATTGKHKGYCKCGASEIESHSPVEYEYLNNDYHVGICECGSESQGRHMVSTTTRPTAPCIYCHATVTVTSGTIMPWGSKDEPELN